MMSVGRIVAVPPLLMSADSLFGTTVPSQLAGLVKSPVVTMNSLAPAVAVKGSARSPGARRADRRVVRRWRNMRSSEEEPKALVGESTLGAVAAPADVSPVAESGRTGNTSQGLDTPF